MEGSSGGGRHIDPAPYNSATSPDLRCPKRRGRRLSARKGSAITTGVAHMFVACAQFIAILQAEALFGFLENNRHPYPSKLLIEYIIQQQNACYFKN